MTQVKKRGGARVTGLYVIPPYVPPMYAEGMVYVADLGPRRHKELMATAAKKALAAVSAEARRRGIAGLLLGSETSKVLTHSRIPVLVVR